MHQISYTISPAPELLVANGDPVWPCESESSAQSLRDFCHSFGCGANYELAPSRLGNGVDGTDGFVIAVGAVVAPEAALYAHLTGRRLLRVKRVDQIRTPPDVIVLLQKELTASTCRWISGCLRKFGKPGVVSAGNLETLRLQVLIRSAAARLVPDTIANLVLSSPKGSYVIRANDGLRGGEKLTSEHDVRAVIARQLSFIGLLSHSDGVDASFGPTSVLCPFASVEDTIDMASSAARIPICLTSGFCHRLNVPKASSSLDARLIDMGIIRAWVFLILGCSSLPASNGAFPLTYTLATNLGQSPSIGVVVGAWRSFIANVSEVILIADSLLSGLSIGQSLQLSLLRSHRQRLDAPLILVGDPRVRLHTLVKHGQMHGGPCNRNERIRAPSKLRNGQSRSANRITSRVTFASAVASSLAREWHDDHRRKPHEPPLPSTRILEKPFKGRLLPDQTATLACAIALSGEELFAHWQPHATEMRCKQTSVPCPSCRRTDQVVVHYDASLFGSYGRRLAICSSCGVTSDGEAKQLRYIAVSGRGTVTLIGSLPKTDCAGVLAVRSAGRIIYFTAWARTRSGTLARRMRIDCGKPLIGACDVRFVLVHRGEISCASRRVYGLDLAARSPIGETSSMIHFT